MKSPISTVVAVAVGLIVLLGTFLPIPLLVTLRSTLLGWAVILAAVVTLIGIVNLLAVHFNKIGDQAPGNGYSFVLITAFLLTLILGAGEMILRPGGGMMRQVVGSIQVPVEASLMAVLAASLAFASIRLLRRRRSLFSLVFFVSVLLFLFLGSGILGLWNFPFLPELVAGAERLPVAGARGLLLGIGLGSLLTGLRVLVGADRPFGG